MSPGPGVAPLGYRGSFGWEPCIVSAAQGLDPSWLSLSTGSPATRHVTSVESLTCSVPPFAHWLSGVTQPTRLLRLPQIISVSCFTVWQSKRAPHKCCSGNGILTAQGRPRWPDNTARQNTCHQVCTQCCPVSQSELQGCHARAG